MFTRIPNIEDKLIIVINSAIKLITLSIKRSKKIFASEKSLMGLFINNVEEIITILSGPEDYLRICGFDSHDGRHFNFQSLS